MFSNFTKWVFFLFFLILFFCNEKKEVIDETAKIIENAVKILEENSNNQQNALKSLDEYERKIKPQLIKLKEKAQKVLNGLSSVEKRELSLMLKDRLEKIEKRIEKLKK